VTYTSSFSSESAEVRRTINAYDAAHLANDATVLSSFWTDDIIMVFSRSPETVRGRAALESLARNYLMGARVTKNTWEIEEISGAGDVAFAIITFHQEASVPKGNETARGRLLYLFKRQPDLSWKIARGVSVVDELTTIPE
jgi:ketosteroid isomerase-like protein